MNAVHALRFQHAVITLCRVLGVQRSSYYKHFNSKPSPRSIENQDIRSKILTIYTASNKRLGVLKIRRCLDREYGIHISQGRIYRLMKNMNLPKMSTAKPSAKPANKHQEGLCPNVIKQNFSTAKPNLVWVSDITFVKVNGRFAYVCVIIDLFSRKVISWQVSNKIDTDLVISTFQKAYSLRKPPNQLIFHSDRGCQYTSSNFRKLLDNLGVVQSFSAKGYPYDNAVSESFFKYLKKEELLRHSYASIVDLKLSLFQYIDGFYNRSRPHSAIHMLTPDEFEDVFFRDLVK